MNYKASNQILRILRALWFWQFVCSTAILHVKISNFRTRLINRLHRSIKHLAISTILATVEDFRTQPVMSTKFKHGLQILGGNGSVLFKNSSLEFYMSIF